MVDPGAVDNRVIARTVLASRTTDGHDFLTLATEMPEWEREPFTSGPVRIVLGEEDPLVPMSDLDAVHEMYPNADVTILEQCAHFAHLEQPGHTLDEIVEFFAPLG